VLGGGLVKGSIVLLGGEPGIVKSTLLLQVCNNIGDVLYVSAEESVGQVKMRAERLGVMSQINMIAGGQIDGLEELVSKTQPSLLVIDSIQTVYLSSVEALPGSVTQVRECGMYLQQIAKKTGVPTIVVGHVTKDGNIAGPRIVEHLVDVVLYLEGDRFHDARILRGVKNRFGSTNEVGIFQMAGEGMVEVKNPSEIFLNDRAAGSGSIVTAMLEGNRPILVELQALVAVTNFGYPKRTSSGFDLNRLNLLAAIISKKTKVNLNNYDIYINVIGGLKIAEPAADLAVCAAIISSFKNKALPKESCVFGEVGLSGEIRKVARQKEREEEAQKLGYKTNTQYKDLGQFIDGIV
jgi:DNA repair protein RadA/Sms